MRKKKEKVIGELTGTMAATLSAEEEQVGLDSLFFMLARLSLRVTSRQKCSNRGATWRYFWPCALRVRNRSELAMSAVRNGFVAKWSRKQSGNAVSISGA